jgi:hypothetical protein
MKIKSNFYDYYDFVGDSDFAEEPIFERFWLKKKPKLETFFDRINMKNINAVFRWHNTKHGEKIVEKNCVVGYRPVCIRNKLVYGIHYLVIGFCGKLFPIIIIDHAFNAYPQKRDDYSVILEVNQLDLMFPKNERESNYPERHFDTLRGWFTHFIKSNRPDKWGIHSRHNQGIDQINSLFEKLYRPVFLIEADEDDLLILEPNPNLRDFNFVKLIDPYTAYQEINMFLGSIMTRPEKPMLTISDKDKIQQHGFDKFSFKAMKGDKKPRSKNKSKKNDS